MIQSINLSLIGALQSGYVPGSRATQIELIISRVVMICLLISASCARQSLVFRVVPAAPHYLLHYPDSQKIAFPDVLHAYNDFEPGRAWIDLRPNMELHIEDAFYRPGMSRRGLAGFLGTETAQYKVLSPGRLRLLSVRSMKDRPNSQLPVQQLIPSSQQHHRYFRFYYELVFRTGDNSRGSVLLSANGKDDIDRLAAELMNDPDAVCAETSANCTVFPDACSVSIEMEVVVNGSRRNVIWGSVLSDVVGHPRHLELLRSYHGRLLPVRLDANDPKALRLPLLPGDQVKWS